VKFAHVIGKTSDTPELAVVINEAVFPVRELGEAFDSLQDVIEAGPDALARLSDAAKRHDGVGTPLTDWELAPAVNEPPIVLAVGLNYDEHASELSLDNDSGPVLFSLFPNSLNGHRSDVPLPQHLSEEVDYEGELGVIIGKPAKNVRVEDALDYVFGYTVVNDITARNLQFSEPQWSRCKSFDGFTPVGPVVVTADEIPDPQALRLTTDVTLPGQSTIRAQDSSTGFMIRSVAQLIASLSQSLTLLPGTLISTGSPGGAGRSRTPQLYLVPGTEVTVSIEEIGALTNTCVAGG